MAYNFNKKVCDRCGISKKERENKPPMDTGINHGQYRFTTSFYLSFNGEVHCPECHKENELKSLFKMMDSKDFKKRGNHAF